MDNNNNIDPIRELTQMYQEQKANQQTLSGRLEAYDKYRQGYGAELNKSLGTRTNPYMPTSELVGGTMESIARETATRENLLGGQGQSTTSMANLLTNIASLQGEEGWGTDTASFMRKQLGPAKYQKAVNDLTIAEGLVQDITEQSQGIASGRLTGKFKNWLNNYIKIGNYRNYNDFKKGNMGKIARAISGEVGVLNEKDIQRAEGLFPRPDDTNEEAQQKIVLIAELVNDRRNMLGLEPRAVVAGDVVSPFGVENATITQNLLEDY